MQSARSNSAAGSAQRPAHIPALDGLRGLAALVMVFYHLFVANWATSPTLHFIQKFITAGWVGVDLFFVLSGFLITGILLNALDDDGQSPAPHYFSAFYARRALRIFPLYYLVLLFAIAFPAALGIHWSGLQWVFLADLQNNLGFLITRPFYLAHPPDLSAIEHLWTLGLEEQFYLLWPVVVYLCRNRQKLLVASLTACIAALGLRIALWAHGAIQPIPANSTPCRFDALLLGSCLALALHGGLATAARDRLIRLARPTCLAMLATILILAFARQTWANEDPVVYTIGFTLLDVFFAALILVALQPRSSLAAAVSIAPLRTLGTYSYGLYVYHELLAAAFKAPLRAALDAHHSKLFGVLASTAALALLSLALAVLSYHLIEKPFLRLKSRFPYARLSPDATAA
jgi:peptidoglycan/LPS O-acetylase OafA/YrhL